MKSKSIESGQVNALHSTNGACNQVHTHTFKS